MRGARLLTGYLLEHLGRGLGKVDLVQQDDSRAEQLSPTGACKKQTHTRTAQNDRQTAQNASRTHGTQENTYTQAQTRTNTNTHKRPNAQTHLHS